MIGHIRILKMHSVSRVMTRSGGDQAESREVLDLKLRDHPTVNIECNATVYWISRHKINNILSKGVYQTEYSILPKLKVIMLWLSQMLK